MYSEALEAIIDAALADGVLTDKEREVLHKRAEQEGIDPDELDVVIEGKLAKMKREEDWLRPSPPAAATTLNKLGNVMKCPNCGAPYESGTAQCAECGHVFQNREAISSSQKLFEGIQAIQDKWATKITKVSEEEAKARTPKKWYEDVNGTISQDMRFDMYDEIRTFITNFPIPTTKDDLLEFISTMSSRRHGEEYEKQYRAKLKEAINKATVYFPNDPQFMPLIEKYTKNSWGNLSSDAKQWIWFAIGFVILMILLLVMKALGFE